VTQSARPGPFQIRLKFGKQAYCVIEVRRGEEAAEIERRYPTDEVRALVAEIRRLNAIAETAGDLVRALEPAALTITPRLVLIAPAERLEAPAMGHKKGS
jgi:hypothetical protein